MAEDKTTIKELGDGLKMLAASKAKGPDKDKLNDIAKKAGAFLKNLNQKASDEDKLKKEIAALVPKVKTYNSNLPKLLEDARTALKAVNEARGKVGPDDQKTVSALFNTLSGFQSVPPSLKFE